MANTARTEMALLLRRAGFTATPVELDAAVARGYSTTLAMLLAGGEDPGVRATPPPEIPIVGRGGAAGSPERAAAGKQRAAQGRALTGWWIERMVAATVPLPEKLTWFWHGHFATSVAKVREPALMLRQNELFRRGGQSAFGAFTLAVATDPAMLVWLDAGQDKAGHPNENFARELMELFTLGIGRYEETDVREAARGFTGWAYDRGTDSFVVHDRQHDGGTKTLLGVTGPMTGADVVSLVTHRPDSARWVLSRLWSRFAYPVAPGDPVVTDLLPAYSPDQPTTAALQALFTHPAFLAEATHSGLVRQPVEYVVAILRLLGLRAADLPHSPIGVLRGLGQVPFAPPSVGGWPTNRGWLSTASALQRAGFVQAAVPLADLSAVADQPAAARVDATAHLLGIDGWTSATATVLRSQQGDPTRLVSLALLAPEFVLN